MTRPIRSWVPLPRTPAKTQMPPVSMNSAPIPAARQPRTDEPERLLPAGRGTLEQVGANLGVHPRALQRQLEREGRTFAMLLNEVRRELTLPLQPRHSAGSVARITGYATPSSFSRWFSGEFDMSPAHWRAEEKADEA